MPFDIAGYGGNADNQLLLLNYCKCWRTFFKSFIVALLFYYRYSIILNVMSVFYDVI